MITLEIQFYFPLSHLEVKKKTVKVRQVSWTSGSGGFWGDVYSIFLCFLFTDTKKRCNVPTILYIVIHNIFWTTGYSIYSYVCTNDVVLKRYNQFRGKTGQVRSDNITLKIERSRKKITKKKKNKLNGEKKSQNQEDTYHYVLFRSARYCWLRGGSLPWRLFVFLFAIVFAFDAFVADVKWRFYPLRIRVRRVHAFERIYHDSWCRYK